jgi:hypothetical protein
MQEQSLIVSDFGSEYRTHRLDNTCLRQGFGRQAAGRQQSNPARETIPNSPIGEHKRINPRPD